jgi:hypothetical protein
MVSLASTCKSALRSGQSSSYDLDHLTLAHSWEFFTTLDYEWSVIRGRRPYRWTIWVCDRERFFGVSLPPSQDDFD